MNVQHFLRIKFATTFNFETFPNIMYDHTNYHKKCINFEVYVQFEFTFIKVYGHFHFSKIQKKYISSQKIDEL